MPSEFPYTWRATERINMNPMITKEVKKLWQNKYASVRDYEVAACLKSNSDLQIKYKGKTITVPVDRLKYYKPGDRVFASKFGKPYKLIDIPFIQED